MIKFGKILKSGLVTVLLGSSAAFAGVIAAPAGLEPGEQFRIMFVSSTGITAGQLCNGGSYCGSDYDTFVAAIAAAAGLDSYNGDQSVTWSALASAPVGGTPNGINALAGSAIPIYDLSGDLIADSSSGIWSGSLLNPIDITENFTTLSTTVWTGTNPNGQHTGCEDLGNGCGPGTAEYGISTATNGSWTAAGIDNQTAPHSIYAFSSVITAESTATPEPSTFLLLGVTMIGLAGWRIQKTRSA